MYYVIRENGISRTNNQLNDLKDVKTELLNYKSKFNKEQFSYMSIKDQRRIKDKTAKIYKKISTNKNSNKIIDSLVNKIKEMDDDFNFSDFLRFIQMNLDYINIENKKPLRNESDSNAINYLRKFPDFSLYCLAERFFKDYFKRKMEENKISICSINTFDNPFDSIYNKLDIKIFKNLDNIGLNYCINKAILSNLDTNHCCIDCRNVYPSKCDKVFDVEKKLLIDENTYNFIKSGYQEVIKNEDGIDVVDKFIVTNCENQELIEEKKIAKGKILVK